MPTTPAAVATPLEISATSGASVSFGVGAPPPPPPPPAPTITLSSDGAAVAGTAEAITVTAANLTGPITVTMESVSGPGVSWSPTTVAPAPGELVKLSMATWAAAGTAQVRGTAPGGIVSNTLTVAVSPAPPPPPPAHPLAASLDLIAAAKTAGQMWVRLDDPTGTTFPEVVPADALLDFTGGVPNSPRGIFYVWPSWSYNPTTHTFTSWGVGHANSSAGEVISWRATSRDYRLDFNGPQLVQTSSYPSYRAKDFNSSPVSAHNYCNSVSLPVSGRYFVMPGATYGDAQTNKVWDTGIPGFQTELRPAGAWSLDMTLAGQGYVGGATGSNRGTPLPGANAWRLHDWFEASHPTRPVFGGTTYANHVDRGAVAVTEDGKDVVYYTAGSANSLLRAEIHPTDYTLDVVSLVFADISFYADGELLGSGNIAIDPVDRVLVSIAKGAGSFESFRFVDLKRTTKSWRRPTTPTGDAALKSESKGEPGLLWDSVDGCYVGFCRGSVGTPGLSPASMWQIFKPAPSGGVTPDAGWSVVRRDIPGGGSVPPVTPVSGETFNPIAGRWRWADDMRVGLFPTQDNPGQIWAYIPAGWTDPRL
jgi:hypothetical protein